MRCNACFLQSLETERRVEFSRLCLLENTVEYFRKEKEATSAFSPKDLSVVTSRRGEHLASDVVP